MDPPVPQPAARPRKRRPYLLPIAVLAAVPLLFWWRPEIRDICCLPLFWLPATPSLFLWGTGLSRLWEPPWSPVIWSLRQSGPVFIKLGQWLSTRRDLLPNELCDAMSVLHEQVQSKYQEQEVQQARALVGEGLIILKEGRQPLGGGCIAQVYHGTYDGEPVAVKVLRPRIRERLDLELSLLHRVAGVAELVAKTPVGFIFPSLSVLKWLRPQKIVEDFKQYMMQQVNLTQEAVHMDKFRENFKWKPHVVVPKVYAREESMLVMGIAEGVSLSEYIKQNTTHKEKALVHALLTDMMAKMGIQDGFLHGDLHPGNLFIDFQHEKPTVTLIDTGISIGMSKYLHQFTQEALVAAMSRRPEALGKAMYELHQRENCTENALDVQNLQKKVGYLMLAGCWMVEEDIWKESFESFEDYNGTQVGEYFNKLMKLLTTHRVPVATDLWSMMTAFALIEGSITELGEGVNVLKAARPYLFGKAISGGPVAVFDYVVTARKTIRESDKESERQGRK